MLEKIQKMADNLQPTDFENSNVDAAVIIIASKGKMTVVGGGNVFIQAKGIAHAIKNGGTLMHIALMAALEEDE